MSIHIFISNLQSLSFYISKATCLSWAARCTSCLRSCVYKSDESASEARWRKFADLNRGKGDQDYKCTDSFMSCGLGGKRWNMRRWRRSQIYTGTNQNKLASYQCTSQQLMSSRNLCILDLHPFTVVYWPEIDERRKYWLWDACSMAFKINVGTCSSTVSNNYAFIELA